MTASHRLKGPLGRYGIYVLLCAAMLFLPLFVPIYAKSMIVKILIYGIFALSLNLLFGYAGLFSLGHAVFFGVGAYTGAILISNYNIESFWLIIGAVILAVVICAALFAVIALQVSDIYFLLVTLAIGQLFYSVALKWRSVTGGSNGIVGLPYPNIGIPGFEMTGTSFYYFVLVCFILCFFLLYRLAKSPFGGTLQGIRGDEHRMRCLGYNTWIYKFVSIVVAGLFAGIAGVLLMYHDGFVGPDHLGFFTSTMVMLMVILGSDRVFWGPVLGVALVVLLEYFASLYTPERWPMILGGAFVLSVTFLRGGVAFHLVRFGRSLKIRYGITKT